MIKVMNSRQVCEYMGVSYSTLRRLIAEGLPHHQREKHKMLLFDMRQIKEWFYKRHTETIDQKIQRINSIEIVE